MIFQLGTSYMNSKLTGEGDVVDVLVKKTIAISSYKQ